MATRFHPIASPRPTQHKKTDTAKISIPADVLID